MSDSGQTKAKGSFIQTALVFALKLAVTCACFWYVSRQINVNDFVREGWNLDFRWLAFATIIMMIQIPLVGVRWAKITDGLNPNLPRTPRAAMLAITAISNFLAQVIPNLMSDAIRIWFLAQIRPGWRKGLAGVVIDRGVGITALLVVGFVTLLIPSDFTALGGYRKVVLSIFGVLLIAITAGLAFAPKYAQKLAGRRATRWIGEFILASGEVLVRSPVALSIVFIAFLVHLLSIFGIWSLGEAFSMSLTVIEAAVLFTLMVAIAIIPVSVSGWGLRELAVTAFLNAHGMPAQRALLFSVCFGLILVIAAMPGAAVLIFYSARKTHGFFHL